MSLDWNLTEKFKTDSGIHRWTPHGYTEERMHPKLHAFIFLTMVVGMDMNGDEKKRNEFKRRLAHLRQFRFSTGIKLHISKAEHEARPEMWPNFVSFPRTEHDSGEYELTLADVDLYWGVSTNASRLTNAQWAKRVMFMLDDNRERAG